MIFHPPDLTHDGSLLAGLLRLWAFGFTWASSVVAGVKVDHWLARHVARPRRDRFVWVGLIAGAAAALLFLPG